MTEKKSMSARIGSALGTAIAFILAIGMTLALAIIVAKFLRWLWFF